MENTPRKRNANGELLRIIAMCMVVLLHFMGEAGVPEGAAGVQRWIYGWIYSMAFPAVDLFILLSGYYSAEARFRARNVFRLTVLGVWVYSVIFSFVSLAIRGGGITGGFLLETFLPYLTKRYWFVNSYIALYLLTPFLNRLLRSLSLRQCTALVAVLVLTVSVRVTFLPTKWSQDPTDGLGLLSFLTLYCVGAWLRRLPHRGGTGKYWLAFLVLTLGMPLCDRVLTLLGMGDTVLWKLYSYSSLPVYLEAAALLLAFVHGRPIEGRAAERINALARYSFSVYIIHYTLVGVLFVPFCPLTERLVPGLVSMVLVPAGVYLLCAAVDLGKTRLCALLGRQLRETRAGRLYLRLTERWDGLVNGEAG